MIGAFGKSYKGAHLASEVTLVLGSSSWPWYKASHLWPWGKTQCKPCSLVILMGRGWGATGGPQDRSGAGLLFSCSVTSNSLWPHGLRHPWLSCPSPTPRACSDACPSSWWCHLAISSSVIPFSYCPQSLPASVFSSESTLHMRWPKYWSFSFSIIPSKEIPGPISFRMDWPSSYCLTRQGMPHEISPVMPHKISSAICLIKKFFNCE